MKILKLIFLSFAILLISTICNSSSVKEISNQFETTIGSESDSMYQDYKLIINGECTISAKIDVDENSVKIPLIAILETLGARVNWTTNSKAKIKYNGNKYILDLDTCSMCKVGQSFNLLSPPPGGTRSFRIIEHELMLDSSTVKGAFQLMGTTIKIELSETNNIVSIEVM